MGYMTAAPPPLPVRSLAAVAAGMLWGVARYCMCMCQRLRQPLLAFLHGSNCLRLAGTFQVGIVGQGCHRYPS